MPTWKNDIKDLDHPVARILKDSMVQSKVVVNKQAWFDWVLVKSRFKYDMQTWLYAKGISDPNLDYGLYL